VTTLKNDRACLLDDGGILRAGAIKLRLTICNLAALLLAEVRNHRQKMRRRLGAARDTRWIAEPSDSLSEGNRRAVWSATSVPGEDAAARRDSLPLASLAFRLMERV